jgi:uncharacterized membrane protein
VFESLLTVSRLTVVPEFLLPDWVPNAHPLIVHFPIALIFIALAADTLALWLGERWETGWEVATGLYVATGLSAIVSYYSGTWAIDTVTIATADAARTLSTHSHWAWYTMLATGGYALVRTVGVFVPRVRGSRAAHVLLLVVGLGTVFPLYKTGENGGAMVYKRGVGVTRVQELSTSTTAMPDTTDSDTVRASSSTSGATPK